MDILRYVTQSVWLVSMETLQRGTTPKGFQRAQLHNVCREDINAALKGSTCNLSGHESTCVVAWYTCLSRENSYG